MLADIEPTLDYLTRIGWRRQLECMQFQQTQNIWITFVQCCKNVIQMFMFAGTSRSAWGKSISIIIITHMTGGHQNTTRWPTVGLRLGLRRKPTLGHTSSFKPVSHIVLK